MYAPLFKELLDRCQPGKNIIFLPHKNPDLDAVGSCAALASLAVARGCNVEIVISDDQKFGFDFIPFPFRTGYHTLQPDFLVVCDTAVSQRIYYPDEFRSIPLVLFDHHQMGDLFDKADLVFVDSQAPSCADFIAQIIIEYDDALITKDVAQHLLDGVVYDTQFFKISSTTSDTLRRAALLIDKGASLEIASDHAITKYEFDDYMVRLDHIKKAVWYPDLSMVVVVIAYRDIAHLGYGKDIVSGIINTLAQDIRADLKVLVYQDKTNTTKVSFRSEKTNVYELAKFFGGGGHIKASGVSTQLSPEVFVENLIQLLRK